jgi:hypothetical protein
VKGRAVDRDVPADEIGWCHQCGHLQLFRDAPWLPCPDIYEDREPVPCCAFCRTAEPWEFGVWDVSAHCPDVEVLRPCAEVRHVTWLPDRCEECGRS